MALSEKGRVDRYLTPRRTTGSGQPRSYDHAGRNEVWSFVQHSEVDPFYICERSVERLSLPNDLRIQRPRARAVRFNDTLQTSLLDLGRDAGDGLFDLSLRS